MKNLDDIRSEINAVDDELLNLIIRRLNLSKDVAEYKKANNLPILDRDREKWILDHISEGIDKDLVVPLRETYETLFRVSRRRQSQLIDPDDSFINSVVDTFTDADFPTTGSVAISGDNNDATVAKKLFDNPLLVTLNNDLKVVDAVNAGLCQFGILPIEDNRSGANAMTYDLLAQKTCHIVRGIKVNLHYKMVSANNVPFSSLKTVVLDQRTYIHCSDFLAGLDCNIIKKGRTDIMNDLENPSDNFIAWIIPSHIEISDALHVIREEVANPGDYMRYICLAKDQNIYPNVNCVSLMFSTPNQPGGLDNILSPLAALDINLNMLESRPVVTGDVTESRFFMDMGADVRAEQVQTIINDLSRDYPDFTLLGAYENVELSL